MATTPLEANLEVTGLGSLTIEFRADGTDPASADGSETFTELTNSVGVWTSSTTDALSGLHKWLALSGATPVGSGYVDLADTTDRCYLVSYPTPGNFEDVVISAGGIVSATVASALTGLFPVAGDGTSLTLVVGDDYSAADGREIDIDLTNAPDINGATLTLTAESPSSTTADWTITGTGIDADTGRFTPAAADTGNLKKGDLYEYGIRAAISGRTVTLVLGDGVSTKATLRALGFPGA